MAEQMMRLRRMGVRRPRRDDPGREQAGQREASGDEHRHSGPVTGPAGDIDDREVE
jgi:hypothetical protein